MMHSCFNTSYRFTIFSQLSQFSQLFCILFSLFTISLAERVFVDCELWSRSNRYTDQNS